MGVGNIPEVRALLVKRGYDDAVHQTGWQLLESVAGRASLAPPPVDDDSAPTSTTDAAQQIEAWASTNFAVADAALKHSYPDQPAFVFAKNLKAAKGGAGVLAAQTFLSRLDNLGGPRRATSSSNDHPALALLSDRGITVTERARIRALIDAVQKGVAPSSAPSAASASDGPATQTAKLKLYAWHAEWSGIAHAVVKRRDYLIRMDLATRAKPKAPPTP